MSIILDLSSIDKIPTYQLQRRAKAFTSIISRSINIPDIASQTSSNSIERVESSTSEAEYLNSPTRNCLAQTLKPEDKLTKSETKSSFFIRYRNFLGKAVPVVRRREFEPINYKSLSTIQLVSPKINKSLNNSMNKSSLTSLSLSKKNSKASKTLKKPLPLFSLVQRKLELMSSEAGQSKLSKSFLSRVPAEQKQGNIFKDNAKSIKPITLSENPFFASKSTSVQTSKNTLPKCLKRDNCGFLPARMRYAILEKKAL